jgi:serine/threonine protein kinase
MTVTVGTEFENYILEKEIGRGDLTIVFQARRKSDNALVAIKVVAPQFTFDELFVRRFRDITRQAAKLEHPNIVRSYEVNYEGDVLYIVREFIEAPVLAEVLAEEGPFAPQRMLVVAQQVANALDYAHQKSIMHGDLSANRIYLGLNDHVIVADFGHTQATTGTSLAKQGYAVGSPEVLAPERVHGQGPSRQSDLYSLGILCYQMLNNEPPFTGTPAAILHAQAYEQPRPLHIINPGISIPLSDAIGRILAKGLELRYNTGSEFTRALTVATEGSAPVRVSSMSAVGLDVGSSSARSLLRRPWLWGLIAIPVIAILLIVGFLAVSAWVALRPAILSEPREVVTRPTDANVGSSPTAPATNREGQIVVVVPTVTATATPVPLPSPTPSPTPLPPSPTVTPTLVPFPTAGPPVVIDDSPFTNLIVARTISEDQLPERVGTSFAPGAAPVYLFFDFSNVEVGTSWTHRWRWGDTELDVYDDTWSYSETGTAWVFYTPAEGYQPGPYQVTLEVKGQVVATATFVIEPGGL